MLETRREDSRRRGTNPSMNKDVLAWTKHLMIYLLVSQVQAHNLPEGTTLVEVSWRFWWRQLRQLRQFTSSFVCFADRIWASTRRCGRQSALFAGTLGSWGLFFWNLASKKGHKVCDWSWRSVWHRFAKFVIEQKVATPEGLKDWKSQETPEELRVPCVEQWQDRHKRI